MGRRRIIWEIANMAECDLVAKGNVLNASLGLTFDWSALLARLSMAAVLAIQTFLQSLLTQQQDKRGAAPVKCPQEMCDCHDAAVRAAAEALARAVECRECCCVG